jgi:hypothetical protein
LATAGNEDLARAVDALLRSFFTAVFLLDHAGLSVAAITRTAYRRLVSRRLLLEWETAQDSHRRAKNQERQFIFERLWIPAVSTLLLAGALSIGTAAVAGGVSIPAAVGILSAGHCAA